ncbi:Gluconolactonase [Baekduia alba]|nr:Gluconolactonase [Baekduia alba]
MCAHMLDDLLGPDAAPERLVEGLGFTEGPAWHPGERRLYFSDVPGDARWRWGEQDGLELVARPAQMSNGSAFAPDLSLVVCEHATSRVVAWAPDGAVRILASAHQGRQLNSPNDVCVASDGTVYFTDPTYGRSAAHGHGVDRPPELDVRGLYRVDPATGALTCEHDGFDQPNGLCLSPDERLLYVNDTPRAQVLAFPRRPDGRLATPRVFAPDVGDGRFEHGIVDGMACDVHGNLWTTGPGGIWVFDRRGARLGVLAFDEPNVGNLTWGGRAWDELFVCATGSVYRLRTRVAGHHVALAGH